ncbi:hypothetical protein FACS189467_7600 [Bacteroidia bacterium]|nr:hypothetical protein FACS189467_7600 [Bacteroidia bacterium]
MVAGGCNKSNDNANTPPPNNVDTPPPNNVDTLPPNNVDTLKDGSAKNLPYGTDARQKLDISIPSGMSAAPAIVYIHGGSYIAGDKSSIASFLDDRSRIFLQFNCFCKNANVYSLGN